MFVQERLDSAFVLCQGIVSLFSYFFVTGIFCFKKMI